MSTDQTRRKLCKSAGAVFMMLPIMSVYSPAQAKTNTALRAKLSYQDGPKNGNSCTSCLEFMPTAADQKIGTCKLIPEDDEILAQGYCSAWNTM